MKRINGMTKMFLWSLILLLVFGIELRRSFVDDRPPPDLGITPKTVELLTYKASGYRFHIISLNATPPEDFEKPDFNDTDFKDGIAPFGGSGGVIDGQGCPLQRTVQTEWPSKPDDGSELLVRRVVSIPDGATNVRIMVSVDNDIVGVFFNGEPLPIPPGADRHEGCPILNEFRIDVPQSLVKPDNLVAFHIRDRPSLGTGNESFFEVRILAESPDRVTSNHDAYKVDAQREVGLIQQVEDSAIGVSAAREGGSVLPQGTVACTGSSVDNLHWSHCQESVDYQTMVRPQVEGCNSCGVMGAGSGGLPELEIRRYHRPKASAIWSSFGPGVLSNFDTKIQLIAEGVEAQPNVILFEADRDNPPLTFLERSPLDGDDAIDGLYHETATRAWKSLELFDAGGHRTPIQQNAKEAVLTAPTGEKLVFEIIRTQSQDATPAPVLDGRLIRIEDRNSNAISLDYAHPASSNDEDLGFDRTHLWQIKRVTDAYGVSADFCYANELVAGRWVVERIDLPNGGQLRYNYRAALPEGADVGPFLEEVIHPDGTRSRFTVRFDDDLQLVVIGYDDSADGDGQTRKEVFITPGKVVLSGGEVVSQPPNLVRRIINGDGELVYRNWEDPSDPNINYFYEGGVLTRLILSADGFPLSYARAVSFQPDQDPSTATFEVIETYEADSAQMLVERHDALGRVITLGRDPTTRAVTRWDMPDLSSATVEYNELQQPLEVVDRIGRMGKRSYDVRGNFMSVTNAVGTEDEATWQYPQYNSRGQLMASIDANNNRTDYEYYPNGRLEAIIEPPDDSGEPRARRSFFYDNVGRLTKTVDAVGRINVFEYDVRNRLTTIRYPDGSAERFEYGNEDLANLLVVHEDRNGNRERFVYDHTKRLTEKIMAAETPDEVSDSFVYVPGTSLVSRTVLRGEQTDYERDGRNRIRTTVVHLPGGGQLRTSMIYDVLDRLFQSSDPFGRSTFYVYDVNDRLIRTVTELVPDGLPSGADLASLPRNGQPNPPYIIEEQLFDPMGQLEARIDGRGNSTTSDYDGQGRLETQVEALGTDVEAKTRQEYDPMGNIIKVTHPRNVTEGKPFITQYTYTGRNLQRSVTVALGTPDEATRTTRFTLDGKPDEIKDARGNVTTNIHDSCCGRLAKVTDPTGAETLYSYDPHGNQTSIIDPNGNETHFTYDGLHRQTSQTNAEGEKTRFEYDDDLTDRRGLDQRFWEHIKDIGFTQEANGMATLVINPLQETTLTIMDSLGRTIRSVDANGNITNIRYDAVVGGFVETARVDALGHVWRIHRDGAGRERQIIDPEGHVTFQEFDAAGNRKKVRDPNGVGEDCEFDARNRKTVCTDTKGDRRETQYDAHSNQIELIDGLGAATINRFDARDRRISSTDRNGGTTIYAYDANSNLERVVDAEGNDTIYEYDKRNLREKEIFPRSEAEINRRTMTFDPGGRLTSRTDQAGDMVTYEYDRADRFVGRHYPDGLSDTFDYDGASRIISACSEHYGTLVQRQYDPGGRLTVEYQHVLSETHTISYAYDRANRQTSVRYPDCSLLSRTFTDRNQIKTVSFGGFLIASRVYDPGMRLSETRLGNGLVEGRLYDPDGLLSQLQVSGVTTFKYEYDANKWKQEETVITVPGESQSFRYDDEGRLVLWTRGSGERQTWDDLTLVGDWRETRKDGALQTRTHNAIHEMTSINGAELSYDTKGNLVRNHVGGQYSWDFENRLLTAQPMDEGSGEVRYFYDALGRRLARTTAEKTTVFVYDGQQVVAEYENGWLARSYVYGSYIDEPLVLVSEQGFLFYTANHLYSVAALTDSHGYVVERYRYDAYGERTVTDVAGMPRRESIVGNQIGFTGRYHDPDSGLTDFRSRQYDAELGRFISRDQSYVDGMSLYAAYFVPNGTDPSGAQNICAKSSAVEGPPRTPPVPVSNADTSAGDVFGAIPPPSRRKETAFEKSKVASLLGYMVPEPGESECDYDCRAERREGVSWCTLWAIIPEVGAWFQNRCENREEDEYNACRLVCRQHERTCERIRKQMEQSCRDEGKELNDASFSCEFDTDKGQYGIKWDCKGGGGGGDSGGGDSGGGDRGEESARCFKRGGTYTDGCSFRD